MRKLMYICAVMGMALLFGANAWAGGRLNFMLINQTGHDIVDARIYPTHFPGYESENLLKTALDPSSRVYIGPNYYGEQNLWNIALKWANGYEHTFSKLRLTRYNTYTVYSTPEGVRIRQTFDPKFSNYEFGPDAPSYMGAEPDVKVLASAPEKLAPDASASQSAASATVEPGKAASTSSLAFSNDAANNALALRAAVQRTREGQTNTVSPSGDFKAGDEVRLVFAANKDGHIYWVARDNDGQYQILFPTANGDADNAIVRNKEYTVPAANPLKFGGQGTETIFAILSPNAVADLDNAVKLVAQGKKDEASKLIANMVNGHEQKRTARDIIFEEEDTGDVNEQSQLADGEEVFVGSYQLEH